MCAPACVFFLAFFITKGSQRSKTSATAEERRVGSFHAFLLLFNSARRQMFENHMLLDDDVPFTAAVRRVVITKMCENR